MRLNLKTGYWRQRELLSELPKKIQAKRQSRVYTGLILTLATISFFALFALRPTFLTIARLVAEIKQKEQITQSYDQKIQQMAQAQAIYARAANQIFFVDEALPVEMQVEKLLGRLEAETQASQIELEALKLDLFVFDQGGDSPKEEDQKKVNFNASWQGDYEKLTNFLVNLFASRRLVDSQSFAFSKPELEEEKQLNFSAQIGGYFQNEKKETN